MLYFLMPIGERYGWGICGRYLLREFLELTDVRYIRTEEFERGLFDPMYQHWLDTLDSGYPENGDSPIIQCIQDVKFEMGCPLGKPNVGYTFIELPNMATESIEKAKRFDIMVAGSTWCGEVLDACGVPNTPIIQGVDKELFYPRSKQLFKDYFVVYSGGKFEYRKGQDIVIAAYKVLQQRHKDVMLMCNWYNLWPATMRTMEESGHIRYRFNPNETFEDAMRNIFFHGDIDLGRVVFDMPKPHSVMPEIYRNTDVGLFPNRCEGGTNLVLMEYMAMGKRTIASHSTGHKDLVGYQPIRCHKNVDIMYEHGLQTWPDPDLEETIELLEWAYQTRDEELGDVPLLPTWTDVAKKFLELI